MHYSEQHVSDRNEEKLLSVYKLEKEKETYSAISHNQVLMSEGGRNHGFECVLSHNADVNKPLTAPKAVNKLCE